MRCFCGKEAFYLQRSSGDPLCPKHLIRRLERQVAKEASRLGILECKEITITYNDYNKPEALLVYNSLKERAKRRSCPPPRLAEEGEWHPLSAEKVLYLLFKAFYLGELDPLLDPKEAKNPAYVILPRDLMAYSYVKKISPPKPFGEGPLWELALKVATEQPTETYNSFKLIGKVKEMWG
ncbi:hypothetical protein IPA_06860 [Ignicoccus pacificus DSM 13166]|uniref:Uncharacterized protein n=1 Tax=Ignicoccus pacificus DSM 13166 TaxID=940294 RepID=A0A977KCJ5_9CREN|nr:hypothetical protein IPA_06860 [Ignicoccus pacificus DSM 13166]